jgi:hypothetical protein
VGSVSQLGGATGFCLLEIRLTFKNWRDLRMTTALHLHFTFKGFKTDQLNQQGKAQDDF